MRVRSTLRFGICIAGLVPLVGCSLAYCGDDAFVREAELRTGELRGTAVLPGDRAPAPFAQAAVRGTPFVRRASSTGVFVFSGLEAGPWVVQLSDDQDGNGVPERRRVVAATLYEAPHRRSPSYVPFVGGAGAPELVGVDVGEIVLEGTTKVSGQVLLERPSDGASVPPAALGKIAVVIAGRNLDLPRTGSDGFDLVSLGAEAKTGADAAGAFVLPNVSGGSSVFYLLVLVYDEGGAAGIPGPLSQVSEPVLLRASGAALALDRPIVLPAPSADPARRSIQMVFSPAPQDGEEVHLLFAPPGRGLPPCETPIPDYTTTPFPRVVASARVGGAPTVVFNDAPLGVYDVKACFSESPEGVLFEQPIAPQTAAEPAVLLGPLLLTELPPCIPARPCASDDECPAGLGCDARAGRCVSDDEGWFDCDGDGARGLPVLDGAGESHLALWQACSAACFDPTTTAAVADATCEADGARYDCDDDGDGQPDVTESPACYGVGKGTDSDGDGVCDGVDAWPLCRANTAQACEAGREPDPPRLAAEFGSCPVERRYTEPDPGLPPALFCHGVAPEGRTDCGTQELVCTFQPSSGGEQTGYACEASTLLGCPGGLDCATDVAIIDGLSPCAHPESEAIECAPGETTSCPRGYVCVEREGQAGTYTTCAADKDQRQPSVGSLACTCCAAGEECVHDPGQPTFGDEGYTADVGLVCSAAELLSLWARCPQQGGGTGADAGAPDVDADAGPASGDGCDITSCGDVASCPAGLVPGCDCLGCVDPCLGQNRALVDAAGFAEGLPSTTECIESTDGTVRLSPSAQRLDLPWLKMIKGHLEIADHATVRELSLPQLWRVTGNLVVRNNWEAGGGLIVFDAPLLHAVDGGTLRVVRNPYLEYSPPPQLTPPADVIVSTYACTEVATDCPAGWRCAIVGGGDLDGQTVCHECDDSFTCGGQVCDYNIPDIGRNGTYTCVPPPP